MDAGFFRGTSADQDNRFVNKQKKLMKSMKFAQGLDTKIDIKKVNMETIKPWISEKITKMLGFEDDVVIEYVFNSLEERFPDPKLLQINLTGFLNGKNSRLFLAELWPLLISAQEQATGIPETFLESKKEEIRLRQQQLAATKLEAPKDTKEESGMNKNGSDEKTTVKSRRSHSNSPRSRSRRSNSRTRRSLSPRRRRSRSPRHRSRRSPRHSSRRSRSPRSRPRRSPSPRSRHRRLRSPKPKRSPQKSRRRSSSSRRRRRNERKPNKSRSRSSSRSSGSGTSGKENKVTKSSTDNGTRSLPSLNQQSNTGEKTSDKSNLPPDPWARNPRQPVPAKIREVIPETKQTEKETENKRERNSSSGSESEPKKSMSPQLKRHKGEKKKKSKISKKKKSKKHRKHKKVNGKENAYESKEESASPKRSQQDEEDKEEFQEEPEIKSQESVEIFPTDHFEKQKLKNQENLDSLFDTFLSKNNLQKRSKKAIDESSSSGGESNEEDLRKLALASLSK